jgi:hypothetical protein
VGGVEVGPLTIGTITTVATAKAHGRTDTAHAELEREWCDVQLNGTVVIESCEDPENSDDIQRAIDTVNQSLQRVRLSIPAAEVSSSDGGYQGIVKKDPGVIAADRTINDDESETVPGLQVTVYNDNSEGRSRVITQFASVRAESRYGIVVLPEFYTPEFPNGSSKPGDGSREGTSPSVIRTEPIPFVAGRPPSFGVQYLDARLAASDAEANGNIGPERTPLGQLIQNPLGALLEWLRQSPREFALLFMVFSILALPVYLILRRRAFEQALQE